MLKGKIELRNRVVIDNPAFGESGTLALIYNSPGVASVAKKISLDKELAYDYTSKWNNVAIVSDGTRVLGLGDIGPDGAIPIIEGKSVLFKVLGDINAYPLCIDTKEKEEIIRIVKGIQPIFGAVNIDHMEFPKVLEIVERLRKELSIPVFHDDQHGTTVIAVAALLNALRLLKKSMDKIRIVIAGTGSAGYGMFKLLREAGCTDIIVVDSIGALHEGRTKGIDSPYQKEIAINTNFKKLSGSLSEVIEGADVFSGVSGKGNILTKKMVGSMCSKPIVFALSSEPEILPSLAVEANAIVASSRSDYPNQLDSATVFPSVVRALLDLRVGTLSEYMLMSAATAIANMIPSKKLRYEYIIPKINNPDLLHIVANTIRNSIRRPR